MVIKQTPKVGVGKMVVDQLILLQYSLCLFDVFYDTSLQARIDPNRFLLLNLSRPSPVIDNPFNRYMPLSKLVIFMFGWLAANWQMAAYSA